MARSPRPSIECRASRTNGPTAKSFNANFAALYDRLGEVSSTPSNSWCGDEEARQVDEHLATNQVLLMGRVTYEALSAIAQNHPVEGPDRMSELPKVVFSRTLQEPLAWDNSRVAKADVVEEVRKLKAESNALLRTIGSLSVVKALLEARMVDRLRLTVFPLILGSTGLEPIFAGLPDIYLQLVDTEVLDARLVTLEYRPTTAQQTD